MPITSKDRRQKQLRRSKFIDRLARWVIVGGGVLVILTVLAILFEIVHVAVPLFQGPAVQVRPAAVQGLANGGDVVAALGDEYTEIITLVDGAGTAQVFSRSPGGDFSAAQQVFPILPPGEKLSAAVQGQDTVFVQGESGNIFVYRTKIDSLFDDSNQRQQVAKPMLLRTFGLSPSPGTGSLTLMAGHINADGDVSVVYGERLSGSELNYRYEFLPALPSGEGGGIALGQPAAKTGQASDLLRHSPQQAVQGFPHVAAFDPAGTSLTLAGAGGEVILMRLGDGKEKERAEAQAPGQARITAAAFTLGSDSILLGTEQGGLKAMLPVRNEQGRLELLPVKDFAPHGAAIERIVPSRRSKMFMSYDAEGGVAFNYLTNERLLYAGRSGFRIQALVLSPKDQVMLAFNRDATAAAEYRLGIPHPEVNLSSLFSRLWYENYQGPEFVWQSTGGSDSFEPKLSLVPLIFGTLKATLYAMLFALPIAVLSAMYTSQFMARRLRGKLKPLIELMASIPSVVIGFLLALWLAPFLEQWVVAFFLSLVMVPACLWLAFIGLAAIRRETTLRRWTAGREFLFVLPVLAVAVLGAFGLAPWVEQSYFGGNFGRWLFQNLDVTYDQRNSIVVAVGLGFAIIPIIFSISDDSLSAVPASLSASSLALGASRWQTVWRVVLPSASPGIFAASMIGFGRAVGETMIVLMATGNTAILDPSIFNGMRTLSANIAVEIPEAPVDSSLFRTLFLCAVILFAFTFTINTLAEIIRSRLRSKYGRF